MSIEIRGLNIAIGTKPIVRDVCMGIADGERVGLVELDDDIILLAITFHPRHLPAAEHRFQGAPDHRDIEAEIGDLLPVQLDGDLGNAFGKPARKSVFERSRPEQVE